LLNVARSSMVLFCIVETPFWGLRQPARARNPEMRRPVILRSPPQTVAHPGCASQDNWDTNPAFSLGLQSRGSISGRLFSISVFLLRLILLTCSGCPRSASAIAPSLKTLKRKRDSAQPQNAKRKRDSAQPQNAKRKRDSAQPQNAKRKRDSAQPQK